MATKDKVPKSMSVCIGLIVYGTYLCDCLILYYTHVVFSSRNTLIKNVFIKLKHYDSHTCTRSQNTSLTNSFTLHQIREFVPCELPIKYVSRIHQPNKMRLTQEGVLDLVHINIQAIS